MKLLRQKKTATPTAKDFTPRAVRRAVLMESLQHPATILPVALSALMLFYMGLMGVDPGPFALALGSGLLGVGSWIVNFFIRGDKLAERHVGKLRQRRERASLERIASMESGCLEAGFSRGAKHSRELAQAYTHLIDFLQKRFAGSDGLNADRLTVLAEDTYREGVRILRKALDVHRALRTIDPEKLRWELEAWEQEEQQRRGVLSVAERSDDARLSGLQTKIAGHRRRLLLYDERAGLIERLLAETETLEAALESTYLEVVDLKSPEPLFARGSAAAALERSVAAARRVEDRLRKELKGREDESIYLEASKGDS